MNSNNMQFQQNLNGMIQDLKMQSAGFGNLPLQTIPNSKGNASVMPLRSGRELPQQAAPQFLSTPNSLRSCAYTRKMIKGGVELGGIMSGLTKNDEVTAGSQQTLLKKCRDPKIFSIQYTSVNVLLPMPCWA
ncbi:hypothetical protein CR513_16018, partial [Mucuna pruriens]